MQGKPDYSGLCNVGECMTEDLRRAGDYAFAGGMSQLVEAVRAQAARLATYEAALREIAAIENQDNGGDWDEIEQARIIARKALETK